MKKKILALILSAAVVFSMIPLTAAADETEQPAAVQNEPTQEKALKYDNIRILDFFDNKDNIRIKEFFDSLEKYLTPTEEQKQAKEQRKAKAVEKVTAVIESLVTEWNKVVNWDQAEELGFYGTEAETYFAAESVKITEKISARKIFKYYTFTASERTDSTYTLNLITDTGICGIQPFFNRNGFWEGGDVIAAEAGLSAKIVLKDLVPGEQVRLLAVSLPSAKQPITSLITLGAGTINVKENVVEPAKQKIKELKAGKNKLFVKYNKAKMSGGAVYEIAYKQAGKKIKKTTAYSATKTIKNLKSGKTYIVKVRTVREIDDFCKVAGPWSETKKIKLKK